MEWDVSRGEEVEQIEVALGVEWEDVPQDE